MCSRSVTTSCRRIMRCAACSARSRPRRCVGCTCRRSHATRSRRWQARRPTSCTPPPAAARSSSPRLSPPAESCRRPRCATPCWVVWAGSRRTRGRRSRSRSCRVQLSCGSCAGRRADGLAGCEERGLLVVEGGVVRYRHGLARRVIEESLPGERRRSSRPCPRRAAPLGRRSGAARPPRHRGR